MISCYAKENVAPTDRRARPWLGTIVEISVGGADESTLSEGLKRAFAKVSRVHRLMSYHDAQSDLGRLNRMAHCEPVTVSELTYQVLAEGLKMAKASDGVFDFTVGAKLTELGYLPVVSSRKMTGNNGTWEDVLLLTGCRVEFRRPLLLDLGGIAKGFAVDWAVETLQTVGVPYGCVNAGGDLRVFGDWSWPVQIRHPLSATQMAGEFVLHERSAATSAIYFSRKRHRNHMVSPLLDGVTRQPCVEDISVTVIADKAGIADALTKVIMVRGREAAPLLQQYGAGAIVLEGDSEPVFIGNFL